MIATEEEAIAMACPFRRPRCEGDDLKCLSSSCMAWRWEDPSEYVRVTLDMPDAFHAKDLYPPRGYCGVVVTDPFLVRDVR